MSSNLNMWSGEKIGIFIDGANLYATSKALGFDIDYRKLLRYFRSCGHLIRANYYTALADDQEYSSIRPLVDWLDYNGFRMVTKPIKEFYDAAGRKKVKGDMAIELTVDAMEIGEHIDHMILFSGDGDFRCLIEAIQRKGKRVSVVSTICTDPPMVSDELRRRADQFVDLNDLEKEFGRKLSEPRSPSDRPPQGYASPNDMYDSEEVDMYGVEDEEPDF